MIVELLRWIYGYIYMIEAAVLGVVVSTGSVELGDKDVV